MKYKAPEETRTSRGNLKYLEELRIFSRNNRKNPTKAEEIFWKLLSYKKLSLKFLRQKPMGKFLLDFYCSKLMLDIEIDGDSHDNKKYLDKQRDLYLEQRGIKTVRFENEEVLNNINLLKEKLLKIIEDRKINLR